MNTFIKKYKYILFFISIILIFSYLCLHNYKTIETFVNCSINDIFPPVNSNNFRKDIYDGSNYNYYTCKNYDSCNNFLNFYYYNDSNDEVPIDDNSFITQKIISRNNITEADCLNEAYSENYDFFAIDKSVSPNQCYIFDISTSDSNTLTKYQEKIKIKCTKNKNEQIINYKLKGTGGFTGKGINKLNNSEIFRNVVEYYNPICDAQLNINNTLNEISQNNCMEQVQSRTAECIDLFNELSNNYYDLYSLTPFNYIEGSNCYADITGDNLSLPEHCINTLFSESSYNLGSYYDSISNNIISEELYAEFSNNLIDHDLNLAKQTESELNLTSILSKYMFFIVSLIITIIMIVLNITNPNIITAEILISYIIFFVLIIFITSNYFNIDYKSFNNFLFKI